MADFDLPTNAKVRRNVTGMIVNGRTEAGAGSGLSAADTVQVVKIPENAFLKEVGVVSSATITGGVEMGTAASAARFGTAVAATANTVAKSNLEPMAQLSGADTTIEITVNGAVADGQTVQMWAEYTMDFEA